MRLTLRNELSRVRTAWYFGTGRGLVCLTSLGMVALRTERSKARYGDLVYNNVDRSGLTWFGAVDCECLRTFLSVLSIVFSLVCR